MATFTLDLAQIISLVVGAVLPLLVGLVTARATNPVAKALLLLSLSIVTSVLTEFVQALNAGEVYDFGPALIGALFTFLVGVSTQKLLWKPIGASAAVADAGVTGRHAA